ncbi:MAG: hypothetical protein KF901_12875 [Myxococcales bacterium]|nr:hypothetical protein [Myxococcales bacterium]
MGTDAGLSDASTSDVSVDDTGVDPMDAGHDAGTDAGPSMSAETCEACEVHGDCVVGSYCIPLTVGGRACLPGCNPDLPSCPRSFNCVLDIASGVDTPICVPVGGTCCVDEDADEYGQGVGCLGPDCDDDDPEINPGAPERCNGVDDDCDGVVDNPPTDCQSGRCDGRGDGRYESISGAPCVDATCGDGVVVECGLFTCSGGGEEGNRCASTCLRDDMDDDALCIAAAHCEAGICVPDVPNGGVCTQDRQCVSGHCDNGFCCETGRCCSAASDCGSPDAAICNDTMRCQGTRGDVSCEDNMCRSRSGIEDDSGCTSTTRALTCGNYRPVFCTGAVSQTPPSCPTSCLADSECVDGAHCERIGAAPGICSLDRAPGFSCTRNPECQAGLFCVDGVCCTSTCSGTCAACNLAGSLGTCSPIPVGQDPANECLGFSCAAYHSGFGPGENTCFRHRDVTNMQAVCNGAGACVGPETLCPLQIRDPQAQCHAICQTPTAGTCGFMNPGACTDLGAAAGTQSCGTGACRRTIDQCTGGTPNTCMPGTPTAEVCNGVDNDCDGVVDNGSPASLCPPPPNTASTMCAGGMCSFTCATRWFDVDGVATNGCECQDDTTSNACTAPTSLGSMSVGAADIVVNGVIPTSMQEDWYSISFPTGARGPGLGVPQIALTGPNAGNFVLGFFTSCATNVTCGEGSATGVGSYSFRDNASIPGPRAYTGPHSVSWPTTVIFRVTRTGAAASCAAASYQLTIRRPGS